MTTAPQLIAVDWSTLPQPVDDGGAAHLMGRNMPTTRLTATDGGVVDLAAQSGRTVVFIYPMTATPGVALPDGWDAMPGARGCTPQSCAFRDTYTMLTAAGADHVFGLSAQSTADQREAAARLHLPFPLLSDADGALAGALALPTFEIAGKTLLKRVTLIIDTARIVAVFYPVFPPDRNAADVLAWLNGAGAAEGQTA
ncbi:MAG: peroxiredoxin [Hyphomicrobium sp.]